MARKGNLRGNGFEKNASVDTAASPESADMPLKKKFSRPETSATSESSGYDKENVQNKDFQGRQNGGSRNKSHKGGGSENGKKGAGYTDAKTTKGRSVISRGSGTKETSSMSKGENSSGEVGGQEPVGHANGSIVSETMEYAERMTNTESGGTGIHTQSAGSSHSGIDESVVNGMDDISQHNGSEDKKNRVAQTFVWFKQASEWILQQKPILIAWSAAVLQARDYVISRVHHTWPIVYSLILHFGKLSLLFLVLWLDCSLRGLSSLLRLGTTSFFAIIWCSFFSVIAMAGFFNVLLSLVAVCVVAFFVGYTAAISTMAVLGAVVLWMHGSFWMTGSLTIIAGIIFALNREHLALLITILYSIYSAKCHVGWLGIILCMNLAFISSDILIYFLKSGVNDSKGKGFDKKAGATNDGARSFSNDSSGYGGPSSEQGNFASHRSFGESSQSSSRSVDNNGGPSTSGLGGGDPTSEEEVIRLLDSHDHYAVLGFSRYDNIDVAVLKREYRKKAMLVHPDKNMGNVKAEEAFKKLQNAYEVLLDSVKRKVYDEELRREELLSCFRRFQSGTQRNGRYGPFKHANFEDKGEDHPADSRRITCKKCNGSHVWIQTERTKAQARWCQDCQDYHQAKDGDGWVEQSGRTFMFGMLRKVDVPRAYACVESKIYDATEWLMCQGMKCPPNTHKPTFHVNTAIAGKSTVRGGSSTYKASTNGSIPTNLDENMTEEEFFEWLQNAVASGMFDTGNGVPENAGTKTGNQAKSNKKKRKGKKQW